MADIKKDQAVLFNSIYKIATDLVHAGHVSEWDFKSYVLVTMFYRYISENLTKYINDGEHAAGNAGFDYAKMADDDAEGAREGLIEEKGFFILPSELFWNVRARAASDENLNETIECVFRHIEESAKGSDSESSFAGLFDDFDVNSKSIGLLLPRFSPEIPVQIHLVNGIRRLTDVGLNEIDGLAFLLFAEGFPNGERFVAIGTEFGIYRFDSIKRERFFNGF